MTFIQQPPRDGKPRAIETVWRGYRFRSRLEARWAVFFETLGLSWEYEPEGFDLDGVRYLPDFRVKTPQGEDIWYEIKPKGAVDAKFARFADMLSRADADGKFRAVLLAGRDPLDVIERANVCARCGQIHADQNYVYCYPCEVETIEDGEGPGFLGLTTQPHKGWVEIVSGDPRVVATKIHAAALAARQARFEYGEHP